MSDSVDVLADLQRIADGEGDAELLALRSRAAVAELIEKALNVGLLYEAGCDLDDAISALEAAAGRCKG